MAKLSEWIQRLRYLGRRSRCEDDLNGEVRFHTTESRTAELQSSDRACRHAMLPPERVRIRIGPAEFRPLASFFRYSSDSRSGALRWA
jgi:hypothetical protein